MKSSKSLCCNNYSCTFNNILFKLLSRRVEDANAMSGSDEHMDGEFFVFILKFKI